MFIFFLCLESFLKTLSFKIYRPWPIKSRYIEDFSGCQISFFTLTFDSNFFKLAKKTLGLAPKKSLEYRLKLAGLLRVCFEMVPMVRLELTTPPLPRVCSTPEPHGQNLSLITNSRIYLSSSLKRSFIKACKYRQYSQWL